MKLKLLITVLELIKFISFGCCIMSINNIAYSIEIECDSGIDQSDSLIISEYFNGTALKNLDEASILYIHHLDKYLFEHSHFEVDLSKEDLKTCKSYSIELMNNSKTKVIKGIIYKGNVLINVFDVTKFKHSNFNNIDLDSISQQLIKQHKISKRLVFFETSNKPVNSTIEITYFNTQHFIDFGYYLEISKQLYTNLDNEKLKDYFPVIMLKTNSNKKFREEGKFGGIEYFIFNEKFELVQHGVYSELIDGMW